ncbi:MAG: protein-L-isoaspartate O-methyltransferase, partial [Candidatus Paceibacterota bacterium]
AYINQPLSIGEDQTISQPLTVAFMLELLEPKSGDRILDIGTGSGWQAALLANIISKNDKNKSGKVITIERIEKLKVIAEENFKKYNFVENGVIEMVLGDATKGYKPEAPYDKIVVAAAGDKIPEAWKKQLKVGGRIVAPVESSIYVYNKISEEEFEKKQYFGFSFVPLVKGIVRGYDKES